MNTIDTMGGSVKRINCTDHDNCIRKHWVHLRDYLDYHSTENILGRKQKTRVPRVYVYTLNPDRAAKFFNIFGR